VLHSKIKLALKPGVEPLTFGDLPNSDAEKAYGIIRENSGASQMSGPAGAPMVAAVSAKRDASKK
jgi:hypothetical protein